MKAFVQIVGVALVAAVPVFGEVPSLLNYQGKLTDSGGDPVTGTVEVTVAIYTNPAVGEVVYSEDVGTVPVEDGIYSFNWGENGISIFPASEQIAVADGAMQVFSYDTLNTPLVNPSVFIGDGTYAYNDWAGSSDPGSFIVSVTHTTGFISVVYPQGPPSNGTAIDLDYSYSTDGVSDALSQHPELWMQVSLDGEALLPRHRLVTVPYALMAMTTTEPKKAVSRFGDWGGGIGSLNGSAGGELTPFPPTTPFSGSIRAITASIAGPLPTGTVTITCKINNVATSATVSKVSPETNNDIRVFATFPTGLVRFEAGDTLSIEASWTDVSPVMHRPITTSVHVDYD